MLNWFAVFDIRDEIQFGLNCCRLHALSSYQNFLQNLVAAKARDSSKNNLALRFNLKENYGQNKISLKIKSNAY